MQGGKSAILDAAMQGATRVKKRGRPSLGAQSSAVNKRPKKNGYHPEDVEAPRTAKAWKPPAGSWEDHIAQIDACEDEESGKLMIYLAWKNGQKTQHETRVIYQRCPQKVRRDLPGRESSGALFARLTRVLS
jgi:chromobox protein 1